MTVLLASRCIVCGWAHMSYPLGDPLPQRYIKCVNENCSEKGKRYGVPTMELMPYKGKERD